MPSYLQIMENFQALKDLDSKAFVEIPRRQIVKSAEYRKWLIEEVETKWMREFNQNEHYIPHSKFNQEDGIGGYFGGIYIGHCKLYRCDGADFLFSEETTL